MTRLFTEGFESGNSGNLTLSNSAVSETEKRTGGYSLGMAGINNASAVIILPSASSEIFFRGAIWFHSLSSYVTMSFRSNTEVLGSILFDPDITTIRRGTTIVATTLVSIPSGTWYLFEVRIKMDDSVGVIDVKGNGLSILTYSGDTKTSATTTMDNLRFESMSTGVNYFDDIAINNTSGAVDNSWCGDGHVIALVPNADGDSSDLVGSDGNSASNYALVDDVPHDTDTTYVESATPDDYDLYNLTASGLGATHVIQRVWTESIAKDTTTAGGQIKHVMKTNSSEYDSSAIALGTSYTLQKGAEQLVNPQSSAVWTPAELDALQVGVKIVA